MNDWTYNGTPYTNAFQFPADCVGFVYMVTFTTGMKYIGKKVVWQVLNVKPRIDGQKRKGHLGYVAKVRDHKKVQMERIKRESNWRSYQGSFSGANELMVDRKEIMHFANSMALLNYLEAKEIFARDAIRRKDYINDNVLNRFFGEHLEPI